MIEGSISDWKTLPRESGGVYFIYRGSTLVYIGKSKNLPLRLSRHGIKKKIPPEEFSASVILASSKDRDALERSSIAQWKPEYNGQLTGVKKIRSKVSRAEAISFNLIGKDAKRFQQVRWTYESGMGTPLSAVQVLRLLMKLATGPAKARKP